MRELYQKCLKHALCQMNNIENAEDFACWSMIKFIKGRKVRISRLYVDYLRDIRADSRNEAYEEQINVKFPQKQYDERIGPGDGPNEHLVELNLMLNRLDKIDRAVIILYYIWGLTEKEIGYCFGLTEARACQLKREALKKMKRNVK